MIENSYQQYQRYAFIGKPEGAPGPYCIHFGTEWDLDADCVPFPRQISAAASATQRRQRFQLMEKCAARLHRENQKFSHVVVCRVVRRVEPPARKTVQLGVARDTEFSMLYSPGKKPGQIKNRMRSMGLESTLQIVNDLGRGLVEQLGYLFGPPLCAKRGFGATTGFFSQ